MVISSNSAALFVLDCSYSMAQPRPFTQGSGDRATTTDSAPIDLAKTYIKSKIIQRILRDLRTTPVSLLCYAHRKSKNVLTQRQKDAAASGEGEPYVKEEDVYRNMYEQISMTSTLSAELVGRVEECRAGEGPDAYEGEEGFSADAHSALILSLETFDAAPSRVWGASWKRDVYLLTDGESECDWERWEDTRERFREKGVGLKVLGFNFDDEESGYVEKDKSAIKRTNEEHFHFLTTSLSSTEPLSFSSTDTLSRALSALSLPSLKSVNSVIMPMQLSIGSAKDHPESTITMHVDVKKAVSSATSVGLKRFSLRGFARSGRTGREMEEEVEKAKESQAAGGQSQRPREGDQDVQMAEPSSIKAPTPSIFSTTQPNSTPNPFSTSNTNGTTQPRTYEMGDIGRTLPRLLLEEGLVPPSADSDDEDDIAEAASHAVTTEKIYRYRPLSEEYAAKEKAREDARKVKLEEKRRAARLAGEPLPGSEDELEEEEEEEEEEDPDSWPAVLPEALSAVYEYGGEFVSAEDMSEGVGELMGLKTGMEILGFMKMEQVKFHHRLSDVYYVLPVSTQPGSSLLFSSFINAMFERKSCAIVRFVGKSSKDRKNADRERWPDPKLGIMWPVIEEETGVEYCWWVKMPFAEDLRQLDFPSLTTVTTSHGKILTEHPNLPTEAQQEAMDQFVDDMDLSGVTEGEDKDGNPLPWFQISKSYNPAIHNIHNTLVYRLSNAYGPLPPVSEELVKYLAPPEEVVEKAKGSLKRVREEMGVRVVPPRPKKTAKKVNNFSGAQEAAKEKEANPAFDFVEDVMGGLGGFKGGKKAEGEVLELGVGAGVGKGKGKIEGEGEGEAMEVDLKEQPVPMDQDEEEDDEERKIKPDPSPSKPKPMSQPPIPELSLLDDDSEPEPDTEDEASPAPRPTTAAAPAPSVELNELTYLEDYVRVRDEQGAEVAVRSLVDLVGRLVEKSFSSQNYEKGVKALRRAREESRGFPSFYNTPLTNLLTALRSNPHKTDFIHRIKEAGVGAIIGSKARGGVTEEEAERLLA